MSGPPYNVVQLRKIKAKRAEGKTLCDSGFHKWKLQTETQFDVKLGKLLNVERCQRCGRQRTRTS